MRNRYAYPVALLFSSILAAQSGLILDRGLPKSHLNETSGKLRSNVRWSWYEDGFIGDDFTLGSPGERWVIDRIRTWAVPGITESDPASLGDFYRDVRLYFGDSEGTLTPIVSGRLSTGSSRSENPDIVIQDATRDGMLPYEDFGSSLHVWQIDFTTHLTVLGGETYRFGVWGAGRPEAGRQDRTYAWFNLASHAALSDARQDSADNLLLKFNPAGVFKGSFDANGAGWDKSTDINVQVFGHKISGDLRSER